MCCFIIYVPGQQVATPYAEEARHLLWPTTLPLLLSCRVKPKDCNKKLKWHKLSGKWKKGAHMGFKTAARMCGLPLLTFSQQQGAERAELLYQMQQSLPFRAPKSCRIGCAPLHRLGALHGNCLILQSFSCSPQNTAPAPSASCQCIPHSPKWLPSCGSSESQKPDILLL